MHWLRLASFITLTALALALAPARLGAAEHSPDRFDYREVFELLETQLPEVSEAELHNAAARGLLRELAPRVRLVGDDDTNLVALLDVSPSVFKTYDQHYGYVRLTNFEEGAAEESLRHLLQLIATNQLRGLVLDLRFAAGESYADAVRLADPFFESEQPLIDWGQGWKKSTAKTNALELPVAVLINGETAAAAEALAAMLRRGNVGLLIGSKTAGQASMYREFELTTGQRLRIATDPIKVGEDLVLTAGGVEPDIAVSVTPAQEKLWWQDPYKLLTVSAGEDGAAGPSDSGNGSARRHLNEADLVRMLREGEIPDLTLTPSGERSVAAKPVIRDPALARALDFLKGLAVVRKFRPE